MGKHSKMCQEHGLPELLREDPWEVDVNNTPGIMIWICDECYGALVDEI